MTQTPEKNSPAPATPRRPAPFYTLLWLGACLALIAGWRLMWFLTDDAFIAFRYIDQARLGHGYVWNPPPFLPVEGYTSFLWIVILHAIWAVGGVAPPDSANAVSFLFSCATLGLTLAMIKNLRLPPRAEWIRKRCAILAMGGLVTHRCFVTWTSSGLETAMFNCWIAAWVYALLFVRPMGERRWLTTVATAVTLMTLTRPDGLLFCAATLALITVLAIPAFGRGAVRARDLPWLFPVLAIGAHLIWRHHTYGEWLPNTYWAKMNDPFPACGMDYLFCYVIENAVWLWLALAALWAGAEVTRLARRRRTGLPAWTPGGRWAAACAVITLLAQISNYILIAGGDHFEYRVLSHLTPLLLVSAVWMAVRISRRAVWAPVMLIALMLVSWPIAWTHWRMSLELPIEQHPGLAPRFPALLRPILRVFDEKQLRLQYHFSCIRWHFFILHTRTTLEAFPREPDRTFGNDDYPIGAFESVGIVAWAYPRVAIIDKFGLNDHVIARFYTKPDPNLRMLAHEHYPPRGYVESFRPNVAFLKPQGPVERPRERSMTAEEIRMAEKRWRAILPELNRRPMLPRPENHRIWIDPADPRFDWTDVKGAERYDLYLWEKNGGEAGDPIRSGLADSGVTLGADALSTHTAYHWRVIAHTKKGEIPGNVWTFETSPHIP